MYTIGSSVEIRTKHQSYLYGEEGKDIYHTYKGEVVVTPRYVDYPAVALKTGDPDFPLRIIAARLIDGYSEKEVEGTSHAWNTGKYLVTKVNGQLSCTCVGFQYHRRCKHSEPYKD
jgi:hypothetical protein